MNTQTEAVAALTAANSRIAELEGLMGNIEQLALKMKAGKVSYVSAILESVRLSRLETAKPSNA